MASKQKRTLELQAIAKDKTAGAFKRMNARAKLFGLRMKKVAAGITRSFFSLKGALVGLGAALGFKKLIDDFDELNKRARRLNLPVDEFNELQFAAKLSGVGVERFNAGLRFLQTRVLDAANGNEALVQIFKDFGVELHNIDGSLKTTGTIINEFADGYKTMPEGIERSAKATKLLGEETSAMSTLFEGGAENIKKLRQEAGFFEGSVGGLGVKAEGFNDALTRLGTSLKSVFRASALEAAEKLTGVFNNLAVFIANNRDTIVGFFFDLGRAAVSFFELAVSGFTRLFKVMNRARLFFTGVIGPFDDISARITQTKTDIESLGAIIVKTTKQLKTAITRGDTESAKVARKLLADTRAARRESRENLGSLLVGQDFANEVGLFQQSYEELLAKFAAGSKDGLGLSNEIKVVKKDTDDAGESAKKLTGFFNGAKTASKQLLEELGDAFQIGQEVAGTFFRTLEDGATNEVASLIQGTQSLSQAWQNFGRVFAQIAAQMIARLLVIKAIQLGLNFLFPGAGTAVAAGSGAAGGGKFISGGGAAGGPGRIISGGGAGGGPLTLGSGFSGGGGGGGGLNLTLNVTQNIQHPDGEALTRANRGQADSLAEIVVQKLTERPELSAAVRGA